MESPEQQPEGQSLITRKPPDDLSLARRALAASWMDKVQRAKAHWENVHKRMREDMDFFMGKQWYDQREDDDRYVANLVQRHVQQRVSALYAKNPKAVAKRRKTMDFVLWEEDPNQLITAQMKNEMSMQQTGMPDPQALAILQDVTQGMERRRVLDRVAKTMEILFEDIIERGNVKQHMKQLVRRVCVTGVGFVKIGYHRVMQKRPEDAEKITDVTEQLSTLERLIADRQDDKYSEDHAKAEQLRLLLADLSNKPEMVVDEGLVFDFPQSSSIIVDPRCRQLKGFIGADWVAQEFILTVDEVKEIYSTDVSVSYTKQEHVSRTDPILSDDGKKSDCDLVRVWEIYCKRDGLKYVVADGYPDFLGEPYCPEIKLRRFWPFFVLTFNEVENDRHIYPPSDVRLLTPIQREYNLARQRLREHRNSNRPLYVAPVGMLSDEDIARLQDREANAVIQLSAMQPGQAVNQVIQPMQPIQIDPALYDTTFLFEDIMRTVGSQEANLGSTAGSTATEVSVAESSRMTSLGSNVDDLDEFLSEMTKSAGEVLLAMMDAQTVQKICGPGSMWPTMSAQEISDQLMLDIQAGSSGRPNKAAEIANFERLAPTLIQIPGIDPVWFAKEAIKRMDDGLDLTDAIRATLPSIVAMNAQKQMPTGDPASDPNAQGGQGGQNGPSGAEARGQNGPGDNSQVQENQQIQGQA
jgi:hypothetical protein